MPAPGRQHYPPLDLQLGGKASATPTFHTFRPGAVDHIKKTRNFGSEEQLAAALLVSLDELDGLRRGETPVTADEALYIAGMQGTPNI